MKRLIIASLIAMTLGVCTGAAVALEDDYDDTQSHPLRVAAYLAYPIGFTAEWLVLRPLHYIMSRPYLESMFGHAQHEEVGTYH
ncbi:MAG: hypothetical protein H6Q33_841 [Deltaproteobacteria bacterium]|jgi:hypothetical protein|nr:hypothetical protein [Deltaproteobacteria bacterium]